MRETVTTADELRGERAKVRVSQRTLAAALGMPTYALSAVENGDTGETVTPEFAERYIAALKQLAGERTTRRNAERAK